MTFPGLGGQQPPPQNASPSGQLVPGVTPGVSGQVVARRVIIIGTGGELLVYSPTAAAGNLVASIAGSAGTDAFGNTYQAGITSYSGSNYVQMLSQDLNFFVPGLFQGQQLLAIGNALTQLASGLQTNTDVGATVVLASADANGGSSGITLNAATTTASSNMTVDGSATVNINLTVNGGLTVNTGASITGGLTVDTINGSSNTGSGNNGGVTSGPSGTVSAFPAAGPNHTHAEVHQHPI